MQPRGALFDGEDDFESTTPVNNDRRPRYRPPPPKTPTPDPWVDVEKECPEGLSREQHEGRFHVYGHKDVPTGGVWGALPMRVRHGVRCLEWRRLEPCEQPTAAYAKLSHERPDEAREAQFPAILYASFQLDTAKEMDRKREENDAKWFEQARARRAARALAEQNARAGLIAILKRRLVADTGEARARAREELPEPAPALQLEAPALAPIVDDGPQVVRKAPPVTEAAQQLSHDLRVACAALKAGYGRSKRPTIERAGAWFSGDRKYRYALSRALEGNAGKIVFVGLNPSIADEERDDHTIRRCLRFSNDSNHSELVMINLFALISTQPGALASAADPIGPQNDEAILEAITGASRVVVAWGAQPALRSFLPRRVATVLGFIDESGLVPMCLGTTEDGSPRHPSRLANATKFQPWSPP